jgi:hypothetical protein
MKMTTSWIRAFAIVLILASLGSPPVPAQAREKALSWILNGPAMTTFTRDPVAVPFFANSHPFVIAPKWRDAPIPASWGAVRTRIFTSYAEFERALSNGKIDQSTKAVLYDNEGWNLTPKQEQNHFAQYAARFYNLAHQHGYIVIQTPALSLATRLQPAGERRFDTFVRLGFLANAAKYADAIDIQVQGSQVPARKYAEFVTTAAREARQANPNVLVFAGLSTNPSGHKVTAEQIVRAINATRNVVDGYWFNVPQQGPSCPHCNDFRPDMAIDVLRMLQSQAP